MLASAGVAGAAAPPGTVGSDVSFPQCGAALPAVGAFAIVGVNGGRPFGANPCLAAELAWAGAAAQLYANTADPGPLLSSHWPSGQAAPKPCDTPDDPGADTLECHYDYGWNAAADAYATAAAAYVSLGAGAPPPLDWWLDVETGNSWTADPLRNVAALQGAVDYLASVGAAQVGFYSFSAAWTAVTGGTSAFAGLPAWVVAGAASLEGAQSACGDAAFGGGRAQLAQFPLAGVSADYACLAAPLGVRLAGVPQRLGAGVPSGPLTVAAAGAAVAPHTVTLGSTSSAGRFSTSPAGPWTSTLAVSIDAGQVSSGAFFYRDTLAGAATLEPSGPELAAAPQRILVGAGPAAHVVLSPRRATVRVGGRETFVARVADSYGNRVAAAPVWSVAARRVAALASPGRRPSVRVRALAPGRTLVRARVGRAVAAALLVVRR